MSRRVLLLNRGESVVDVVDWQTAVCLIVKGSATVPYGYDDFYKIPISEFSAERMKKEGKFNIEIEKDNSGIKRGYFLLPTAIVLVEFVHIPYKKAAVNKKNVLKRDKKICGYCGKQLNDTSGTIDHIIPQSRWKDFVKKGLTNGEKHVSNWKNVVASCKPCNTKKGNKTLEEANMNLMIKPFIPSKDYLILYGINRETYKTWTRWIVFDDLK